MAAIKFPTSNSEKKKEGHHEHGAEINRLTKFHEDEIRFSSGLTSLSSGLLIYVIMLSNVIISFFSILCRCRYSSLFQGFEIEQSIRVNSQQRIAFLDLESCKLISTWSYCKLDSTFTQCSSGLLFIVVKFWTKLALLLIAETRVVHSHDSAQEKQKKCNLVIECRPSIIMIFITCLRIKEGHILWPD
jgi:hypothetical protein